MSFESDILAFWNSYQPILSLIEEEPPQINHVSLESTLKSLMPSLVVQSGWKMKRLVEIDKRLTDRWYGNLVVGEVSVPYTRGDKTGTLQFRPIYKETENGGVRFESCERLLNEARARNSCFLNFYEDCRIEFNPTFRPSWERNVPGHVGDYMKYTTSYGEMNGLSEEGKGVFFSSELRKRNEDGRKESERIPTIEELTAMTPADRSALLTRRMMWVPERAAVFVHYGYDSDAQIHRMSEAEFRKGYSHVRGIGFDIQKVGNGEIDLFLKHVGIEYPLSDQNI